MVTLLLLFFNSFFTFGMEHVAEGGSVQWLGATEYDFGNMQHEVAQSVVFEFKNASTQPIVLQTVRTDCGCTAARWTEDAILPGEKGMVKVEYDAYRTGVFRKKIKVFFDCQQKPEILWISGNVE